MRGWKSTRESTRRTGHEKSSVSARLAGMDVLLDGSFVNHYHLRYKSGNFVTMRALYFHRSSRRFLSPNAPRSLRFRTDLSTELYYI